MLGTHIAMIIAVSFYPQVAEGLQTAIQEGNDAVN